MLIPLGEKASVDDVLDKLDILFGEVSDNGMIMQEFFNAFQKSDENATTFGCRLEGMLQNAIDNGYLDRNTKNDLLRHKFWTSLSSDKLKSQTRHKYDTIRSYDRLLLEIRKVEKELSINRCSTESDKKASKAQVEKSKKVQQYGISVEDDVEKRFDRKIERLQKDLEGKIEDKFDQILKRLDSKPLDRPKENYQSRGKGRSNRGKGKFKRGYDNQVDKKSESTDSGKASQDPKG
jgi:hypothetical protein